MEQVITVVRIQPPAPGKKQAAIFDQNDVRWGVYPDDLGAFAVGSTYKVWDWQTSMFQGKQYRTIKSGNYLYQGQGHVPPAAQTPPPRAQQGAAAGAPFRSPPADDMIRRRDIFVCGALNNMLSNPNCAIPLAKDGLPDGQAMVMLVWRLRKVFDYALGPGATDPSISTAPVGRNATPEQQAEAAMGYGRVDGQDPPRNADMNDEIPF